MKKAISLPLIALLALSLLAGCGTPAPSAAAPTSAAPAPAATTAAAASEAPAGPAEPEAGALPLVTEPTTLSIFSALDAKAALAVQSYSELVSFQMIEEKTGVTIDWQHPATLDGKDEFNLMMASGSYPDIIYYGWVTGAPGGPQKYIDDGVILDLTDLVAQYAPNYSAALASDPEYPKQAITDENSMWGFSILFDNVRENIYPSTWLGPIIREDWLEEAGVSAPTNMDEWTEVLRAFKAKWPERIPVTSTMNWWNGNLGLGGFATPYGILWDFYNDNGTVKYGPIEEGAREFLTLMNLWYSENLLDQDFAGQDNAGFDNKIKGSEAGAYVTGTPRWALYKSANADDPTYRPIGIPWPVDKNGRQHTSNRDPVLTSTGGGSAISTSCKNPELAVRWLDYLYSPEGYDIINWGVEGETYVIENGQYKWTDLIVKNPDGLSTEQAIAPYTFIPASGWSVWQSGYAKRGLQIIPGQLDIVDLWAQAGTEYLLPMYSTNSEESDNMARIMTNVNTYMRETTTKMIVGTQSLDDFDKYVAEIKAMGIDEAIGYVSAAVTRYNNR